MMSYGINRSKTVQMESKKERKVQR